MTVSSTCAIVIYGRRLNHSLCWIIVQHTKRGHIIHLADVVFFIHGSPGTSADHTPSSNAFHAVAVGCGLCALLAGVRCRFPVKRQTRRRKAQPRVRYRFCALLEHWPLGLYGAGEEPGMTSIWCVAHTVTWLLLSYRFKLKAKSMTCSCFTRNGPTSSANASSLCTEEATGQEVTSRRVTLPVCIFITDKMVMNVP